MISLWRLVGLALLITFSTLPGISFAGDSQVKMGLSVVNASVPSNLTLEVGPDGQIKGPFKIVDRDGDVVYEILSQGVVSVGEGGVIRVPLQGLIER